MLNGDFYWQSLKNRILKRQAKLNKLCEALINRIDSGKLEESFDVERERLWLDSIAHGGEGLNLCPGHFIIGNTLGINIHRSLAADVICAAEDIHQYDADTFDYIVTNHFESFADPLTMLHNIYRILKPGGILAIVFMDADAEVNSHKNDPVMNSDKKRSIFSRSTMKRYLIKAGFEDFELTPSDSELFLRVKAYKRDD